MKENSTAFANSRPATQNEHAQLKKTYDSKGKSEWQDNAIRICGHWSEQLSSKGKIYFYNCVTEVSQWQKPPEWTLPDMNKKDLLKILNERKELDSSAIKRPHSSSSTVSSSKEPNNQSESSPKRAKYSYPIQRSGVPVLASNRTSSAHFGTSFSYDEHPSNLYNPENHSQTTCKITFDEPQTRRTHVSTSLPRSEPSGANGLRFNNDDMDISPGSSPLSCCSSNSQANCNWHYKRQNHSIRHASSLQPNAKNAKDERSICSSKHSSDEFRTNATKSDAPQSAALRQLVDALRESLGSILAHSPASSISTPNVSNSKSINEHTNSTPASRPPVCGQNGSTSDINSRSVTTNRAIDEHTLEQNGNIARQLYDPLRGSQVSQAPASTGSNLLRPATTSPVSVSSSGQLKNTQNYSSGGGIPSRNKNVANTLSALFNLLGAAASPANSVNSGAKNVKSPCPSNSKHAEVIGLGAGPLSSNSPVNPLSHLTNHHTSRYPNSASPLLPSPRTPLSSTTQQLYSGANLSRSDVSMPVSETSYFQFLTKPRNQIQSSVISPLPSSAQSTHGSQNYKDPKIQMQQSGNASFSQTHNKLDPSCSSLNSLDCNPSGTSQPISTATVPANLVLPNPSTVNNASSNLMSELVHMLQEAITQKQRHPTYGSTTTTTSSSISSGRPISESNSVSTNPNSVPGSNSIVSETSDLGKPPSTTPQISRPYGNGPVASYSSDLLRQIPVQHPLYNSKHSIMELSESPVSQPQGLSSLIDPHFRSSLSVPSATSTTLYINASSTSCTSKDSVSVNTNLNCGSAGITSSGPSGTNTILHPTTRVPIGVDETNRSTVANTTRIESTRRHPISDVCDPSECGRMNDVVSLILDNPEMKKYVDPSTVNKFRDPVAEKHESEAQLEWRKFDRLQSVLYSELSGELKKLRALVRISEAKLAIHRKKKASLQEVMDMLEAQRPIPNLSFSDRNM